MNDSDATAFWALMFLRFHGLGKRDASRFIGEFLAARYDETTAQPGPTLERLLARLDEVEQEEVEQEVAHAETGGTREGKPRPG